MASLNASSLFSLQGAVCVVSGGGTGIGLMCATALANQGARVYITGRRAEVLETAAAEYGKALPDGGAIIPFTADVTSREDLAKLVKHLEEKEGKLHVLINNAGIVGPATKIENKPEATAKQISEAHLASEDADGWSSAFHLNTHGVWLVTMTLLPLLEAGNKSPPARTGSGAEWSGAVVNITSISGLVKTAQHHYAYNASKAASNHLTQMLAHELNFASRLKLRVNALAPGYFPSEMTAHGKPSKAGITDASDVTGHDNAAGRVGTREEMAQAVLLLTANTFINGVVLPIDGGVVTAVPSSR